MPRVRCLVCHRIEDWSTGAADHAVVVVQPGGSRRPAIAPQWARGKDALRSFTGEVGPVVGICEACGQLLVSDDVRDEPGIAPIEVRVDTPKGALVVGRTVRGPAGEFTVDEANEFLSKQYYVPVLPGLIAQLPQVLLLSTMGAPVLLFIACVLAITGFILAAWNGLPPIVRGH